MVAGWSEANVHAGHAGGAGHGVAKVDFIFLRQEVFTAELVKTATLEAAASSEESPTHRTSDPEQREASLF